MANYQFNKLRMEFTEYFKRNKDKVTKSVWEFCQRYGIGPVRTETLPTDDTVYRWRKEILKELERHH